MARKVNIKIGPEAEYDQALHEDILYICNDTSTAFIPDVSEKDTGWLECEASQNAPSTAVAKARQVGKVVTIVGEFSYGSLRNGDLLFTVPMEIGRPTYSMDLDFHQKRSAEKNRGCRIQLNTFGRIIIQEQYSYESNILHFNFTYIIG